MASANTPSLTKKGLTPEEFRELLVSKAQGMRDVSEGQVKKSIDSVIKHFCPVETKKGKLDKRRTSTENYHNNEMLADGGSSLSQQQEDSGGQYVIDLCREYHIEQTSLFSNLQAQGIPIRIDREGYVLNADGRIPSCKEFCSILDDITQTYVAELNERAEQHITRYGQERQKLIKIFDDCKEILMKRLALELVIKNDLMKEKEDRQWKKHVELIASFGFMLVILDSLGDRLGGSFIGNLN